MDQEPKWIPATVAEVQGLCSVKIQLSPNGALQKRHVDQLQEERRFMGIPKEKNRVQAT